jgi:hypothetical protein
MRKILLGGNSRDIFIESFRGWGILPRPEKTVHAAVEGKIIPRERNLQERTHLAEALLSATILLATLDL